MRMACRNFASPVNTCRCPQRGGVAIAYSKDTSVRNIRKYSEEKPQIISAEVNGVPLVTAYVALRAPPHVFDRFLVMDRRALRGPGILAGNFYALHEAWDDTSNLNGFMLHR